MASASRAAYFPVGHQHQEFPQGLHPPTPAPLLLVPPLACTASGRHRLLPSSLLHPMQAFAPRCLQPRSDSSNSAPPAS